MRDSTEKAAQHLHGVAASVKVLLLPNLHRAESAEERAMKLEAKLRALGIDPNQP